MREQLARVACEQAQDRELVRRQMDASPVDGDLVFSRSTRIPPTVSTGSPGVPARRRTARRRASSSPVAERLRDVVVGACIERGDLLVLVTDCGDQDDRRFAPGA